MRIASGLKLLKIAVSKCEMFREILAIFSNSFLPAQRNYLRMWIILSISIGGGYIYSPFYASSLISHLLNSIENVNKLLTKLESAKFYS